jgi:trehalose synthase
MTELSFVEIEPAPLDRFRPLIGDRYAEAERAAAEARAVFGERRIWHVNSTAQDGGVAEMLRALLPYVRDADVDTRWAVLAPEGEGFFTVTKRIHNRLHGHEGDGGALDEAARSAYEGALGKCTDELGGLVEPGDVVYLHDP